MSEAQEDYLSLPLSERLAHKVWKVRLEAYEEHTKQFENSRSEHDGCFEGFNSQPELVKKAVLDANVVAQETAVSMLCSFLQYGGTAANVARLKNGGLVTALCEKGLSSSRAGTKAKATEALLLFVELSSDPDAIVEEISLHVGNRLPKLVAGTVLALTAIVENYGCQVVSPKPLIPVLVKLFSHADRNVRAETTKLAVELYKWMGDALVTLLFADLKPVQQKDLTVAFEKVKDVTAEQKRYTRRQQQQREKEREAAIAATSAALDGDVVMDDAEEAAPAFDAFSMMDPVHVLSKFPSDLNDRIASKVWKERKEVLEEVHAVLSKAPKLAVDEYVDVIRHFAKCMKDANVQVVQLAAECIEFMAKGLKQHFHRYQQLLLGPMIERTKEKKASVADALANALDAVFQSSSLSDTLHETINGMKHKTPQVKISSTNYLQRCLAATPAPPKRDEVDVIMETGVKMLGESLEPVRQAATEMIGTLMKITGERELNTFLERVDDNRKKKIRAFYNDVVVKAKLSSGASYNSSDSGSRNSTASGGSGSISTQPTRPLRTSTIPAKRGATSPAKRPDDAQKVTSASKSLTGRSLITPVRESLAPPKADPGLSLAEKEELATLRREKASWASQKDESLQHQHLLQNEKAAVSRELTEMQSHAEGLRKEHTNALLMVKQKETQIHRLNSDLANAKLKIRDLEQTIELAKLQQNQPKPHNEPQGDTATSFLSPLKPRLTSGELSSRVNRLSIDGEEAKENSYFRANPQLSAGRFASPQKILDHTNTFNWSLGNKEPGYSFNGTSDESWKKAAEVTSLLKARIEKMKARSRLDRNLE